MNRRLVALLIVLAITLQGPNLAYAAGAAAATTMPAACQDHTPGQSGNAGSSCCPQGLLPGLCCADGLVFTGVPSTPVTSVLPSRLLPTASGSEPFATERPAPLLRPPIA
jgi:hypothetical protein